MHNAKLTHPRDLMLEKEYYKVFHFPQLCPRALIDGVILLYIEAA
jgi:hypothetical protein